MIGFLKSRNSVSFFYTIVVEVPCEGILRAVESGVLNVIPFPFGLWPSDISLTHMILLLSSIEHMSHTNKTCIFLPPPSIDRSRPFSRPLLVELGADGTVWMSGALSYFWGFQYRLFHPFL